MKAARLPRRYHFLCQRAAFRCRVVQSSYAKSYVVPGSSRAHAALFSRDRAAAHRASRRRETAVSPGSSSEYRQHGGVIAAARCRCAAARSAVPPPRRAMRAHRAETPRRRQRSSPSAFAARRAPPVLRVLCVQQRLQNAHAIRRAAEGRGWRPRRPATAFSRR